MAQEIDKNKDLDNLANVSIYYLKPDCKKCFGLCCVALYFSAQDGFPTDKKAGTPCPHLQADFRCDVHDKLGRLGLKGCAGYECFGAGQQVSQVTFAGKDWRQESSSAPLMFEVFLVMRQLHEMCWYLTEALTLRLAMPIRKEIKEVLCETERITGFTPQSLIEFDLAKHRTKVNILLASTSELVRNRTISEINITDKKTVHKKKPILPLDYSGRDLRKKDLRGADLRGACLIAANLEGADLHGADFIAADLRDINIRGADLSRSIFLTQSQINVAKGSCNTKLPPSLSRPEHWI